MKYSLQHQTLLSPLEPSTTDYRFHFGPAASFFLELLVIALHSSPVAYWTPSDQGAHFPGPYLFAFPYCPWNFSDKNTGVVCHFLLQWIMFSQNTSLGLNSLGWPCRAWLIASSSYANPFTMKRQRSMKKNTYRMENQEINRILWSRAS